MVYLYEGDSVAMAEKFEDNFFELIFVDGDHSPEGVKRDILAYYPKLKPHGLLLFHDYPTPPADNELKSVIDMYVKNSDLFCNFGHFCGVAGAIKK